MTAFEQMTQKPTWTPEESEFLAWLRKNRSIFVDREYDAREIGWFAKANGFDMAMVYRILSHFNDALTGGHIDNRAGMLLYSFEETVKRVQAMRAELQPDPAKAITLEVWQDLAREQSGYGQ